MADRAPAGRDYTWYDALHGRNQLRIVKHDGDVYVETRGYHNGHIVYTTVKIAGTALKHGLREAGVLV